MSEIEKFPLNSMDINEEQLQKLKQLFPEVFTEVNKIDWDKLKLTLGENVDVGKERFGMNWPGKADSFKIIQQPSLATLVPARDESVNFDTTENLFIEGDNLEVLKLLQKSYLGKIKMIYIDPPFAVGADFGFNIEIGGETAEKKQSIIEEIGELPLSINIVAREQELIRQAQSNHYWATINEDKFEELIQKLSPLMKFREAVIPLAPAKFNLKDIVAEKEFVEFGPQHEALSVAKYRELVEKKINELVSSSPILQKLKQGQEITPDEAEQLAEELHNEHPHITIDLLRKVYNHRKAAMVQFIKHILGIEQLETFAETVTKAFDDFVSKHSYLTSRQLQFLDLLKNFVLEKGDVSKRNLIESPFTMLHPEGIRGIFNQKEIDEILSLTEQVLAA